MTTHHHPEVVLLSLIRDHSAQIPWGLEVSRDEFGHACLVTSVVPMSPAAEAVSTCTWECLPDRYLDCVMTHFRICPCSGHSRITTCSRAQSARYGFDGERSTSRRNDRSWSRVGAGVEWS